MISLVEKLTLNSQSKLVDRNLTNMFNYIMAFINVWKDNKFIKDIRNAIKSWINKFNIKDIHKYVYAVNVEDSFYAVLKDNINDQYVDDLRLMSTNIDMRRRRKHYRDIAKIYNNLANDYHIGDNEVLFRNDGDGLGDEDIYVIGNNEGLLINVMGGNILFVTKNDD